MNKQPGLSPDIIRLLDCVIEGKPISKTVLDIVIKLAGFDRGAVYLADKGKELKLAVSLGIKNDQKAIECMVRRCAVTSSLPVEYIPEAPKLSWFRTARPLRGSFILSYATVAITSGTKHCGILYLDSTSNLRPVDETMRNRLPRLARVMSAALVHDQIISVPTIAASVYLTTHSIRDLERERLLEILKMHDWHVFSVSQELGTKVRVLYSQMERHGIEPARNRTYRKREMTRNL